MSTISTKTSTKCLQKSQENNAQEMSITNIYMKLSFNNEELDEFWMKFFEF